MCTIYTDIKEIITLSGTRNNFGTLINFFSLLNHVFSSFKIDDFSEHVASCSLKCIVATERIIKKQQKRYLILITGSGRSSFFQDV